MIESGMIAERKCDHDFAAFLRDSVEWDVVLAQNLWTDQRHFVAEMSVARLKVFREDAVGQTLQLPAVLRRYGVPCFGLSEVQIVDGVKVHVFRVPGEARFPHPEVQIGSVHTGYRYSIIGVYVIENRSQAIDVPNVDIFVGQAASHIRPVCRSNVRYVLPVFPFEILVVVMPWR